MRAWILAHLPLAFDILGLGAGSLAAFRFHQGGAQDSVASWFSGSPGWEINGFAAFGTMSGFSLAALALVASLAGHERAREVIDTDSGRYLLRTLVFSTWAWFLAALSCLVALAAPAVWTKIVVIMLAAFSSSRGLLALTALALFFRRFTVATPKR